MKAKIYTKTGDKGQTSLVGGTRVAKTHARIEAYGTLDELNSMLGILRSLLGTVEPGKRPIVSDVDSRLQRTQNCLFDIGSHLACEDEETRKHLPNISAADIAILEKDMDRWESELPPLKNFILPGGCQLASYAHLARTVARRAEREVLRMDSGVPESRHLVYLNRLSDWLFLLARKLNAVAGVADLPWTKD